MSRSTLVDYLAQKSCFIWLNFLLGIRFYSQHKGMYHC